MFKLLNLDRVNYLGRRLDKKMFYDNGDFSKEDKKIFIDYIDRIEMSYLINSTNLNIQPFINDEYYYKAIAYLKITLKQDGKLDQISKIINNTIPNPIVIIYELENKYKISTAIKRLSKSEKDKTVIEEIRSTPWLDINNLKDNEKIFINGVILPTKSKEFSMPTEGEISKLNVTNGKIVKEGDVLFTVKNESVISEIDSL